MMTLPSLAPIRFAPWLASWADPRVGGVRLLLLGESHYEEVGFSDADAGPGLTQEIVCRWGLRPEGRQPLFAGVFTMLSGEDWASDAPGLADLWTNVFYYNYVQQLVPGGPGNAPSSPMWAQGEAPFRKVLEELQPEAVLVLGERLWNNMARQDEELTVLREGLGRVCGYRLSNGKVAAAAHTRHPSSPGFSPSEWRPRVVAFLEWTRQRSGEGAPSR